MVWSDLGGSSLYGDFEAWPTRFSGNFERSKRFGLDLRWFVRNLFRALQTTSRLRRPFWHPFSPWTNVSLGIRGALSSGSASLLGLGFIHAASACLEARPVTGLLTTKRGATLSRLSIVAALSFQ